MNNNQYLITLDIDWAPDFVIDWVADQLITHRVRATWFVTHASPSIERLRRHSDLFELGIHPNFLPGSTHGQTPAEVLKYCMKIVPEAVSMRTHSLVQSTPLLEQVMTRTPITRDVSLFMPYAAHLHPIEYHLKGHVLHRFPYYWEDDFEMHRPRPNWCLAPLCETGLGLKIFNFHPIYIYLNSTNFESYHTIKQRHRELSNVPQRVVDKYVALGEGTRTFLMEMVAYLTKSGQSRRVKDIIG